MARHGENRFLCRGDDAAADCGGGRRLAVLPDQLFLEITWWPTIYREQDRGLAAAYVKTGSGGSGSPLRPVFIVNRAAGVVRSLRTDVMDAAVSR